MAFVSTFWTCAVAPLFTICAFTPAILRALELGDKLANLGSAFIIVGCALALLLVNRIGRRRFVL